MPISGFNIGKETALDIIHPLFGIINFGLLTNFNSRPITRLLESLPITNGGESVYRDVFHGWEGTFEVDRTDSTLDALTDILESNYRNGQPETYAMITETITNPDGSIDQYRYKNVVLIPEDHGAWRGEEKVMQRLGFRASRRERA
jgi:hypothetical protein